MWEGMSNCCRVVGARSVTSNATLPTMPKPCALFHNFC
uniref:Uncharacterized protein n=1 Tax=Rhizophora mucronata TaxID=61149 RepID=A0A2P2NK34_RHIMU